MRAEAGCSVTVEPEMVYPGASEPWFDFKLTNSGTEAIRYIKIQSPQVSIQPYTVERSGWEIASSEDTTIIWGNSLSEGADLNFRLSVLLVPTELNGFSGNWTVQTSGSDDGAELISCGGELFMAVTSSAPDETAPVISNLAIEKVGATTVTLSWNTNEPATSVVNYDVEAGADPYVFSKREETLVTEHVMTLDKSLAAETAYYFMVCAMDEAGNEACAAEQSFTTKKAAVESGWGSALTEAVKQKIGLWGKRLRYLIVVCRVELREGLTASVKCY